MTYPAHCAPVARSVRLVEERPPIGATLREARLRQDLEISDCARATRIRERYLVAIEDGRFESLPDPAYVNGFVRAYARHLGVTVEGPVRELPSDHLLSPLPGRGGPAHTPATRVRSRRSPRRRSRLRPAIVLPALVVLGLLALSLFGVDLPLV
jgi:cytoskeletal protein RodZ